MEIRQLRYFITVAEERSFSNAARRLHMSQPPLSLQIKSLEEELGTPLLARTSRQVELTEAGRLFLVHARQSLEQLEKAGEVVKLVAQGEAGEIRVGFTASVPMFDAFPRVIHAFRERYPAARADLLHLSSGQQLKSLADNTLDVSFLRPSMLFSPPPNIETVSLWEDQLALTLPEYHPLAKQQDPIPMAALAKENFVLFPRGLGCGLFDHVSVLANRAGFAPSVSQEAREGSTILGLVAAGMGISILPETYIKTRIPGVVYRKLDAEETTSRILLAFHKKAERSPLASRFIDTVCAAFNIALEPQDTGETIEDSSESLAV